MFIWSLTSLLATARPRYHRWRYKFETVLFLYFILFKNFPMAYGLKRHTVFFGTFLLLTTAQRDIVWPPMRCLVAVQLRRSCQQVSALTCYTYSARLASCDEAAIWGRKQTWALPLYKSKGYYKWTPVKLPCCTVQDIYLLVRKLVVRFHCLCAHEIKIPLWPLCEVDKIDINRWILYIQIWKPVVDCAFQYWQHTSKLLIISSHVLLPLN